MNRAKRNYKSCKTKLMIVNHQCEDERVLAQQLVLVGLPDGGCEHGDICNCFLKIAYDIDTVTTAPPINPLASSVKGGETILYSCVLTIESSWSKLQ